jgi:hypothetical protein
MKTKILFTFITLLGLSGCNQPDKKIQKLSNQADNFIQPPLKDIDISFKEYNVDAAKGDTLFYQTGSIILFPPNAFVDKNGDVIKGNVQIKYREFTQPLDFYLAGIPMDYDSADKKYTFESSGMCQLVAYKDGIPVYVNPKNKPQINLVSNNQSESHNLYYLDTMQRKWVNKEKSRVIDLSKPKKDNSINITPINSESEVLIKPVKPEKADTKSPIIRIVIDPASFGELLVYDNLKFQLDATEKNFNANDANEEWGHVDLQKGSGNGLYILKFTKPGKTVSYSARPVLEGKDYEKALKTFETNNKEYNKRINAALNKQKANNEQYTKDSLENQNNLEENKEMERLNNLIETRNRQIEKQNEIIEKENKQIIDINQSNRLMRSFEIDGFGIWNCDRAISLNCIPITASFKDINGNSIELTNIAVLYKDFNGILKFPSSQIQVVQDADNMIIGVYNGKFAYISYEEYKKLEIKSDTKQQTFTMTLVSDKDNNYTYIKTIAAQQ